MGNEINQLSPEGNDHPTALDIGEWLSGERPAAEYNRIRRHFIQCAECREQMVMIRQATQPRQDNGEGDEFASMLRLGERAAEEARRRRQSPMRTADGTADRLGRRRWFMFRQPALGWATAAVLLLAVVIPVYRFYQGNHPVDRAMASLRQAWGQSRPIEARVTGDFPYLPYQITRNGGATISVNQEQLLAATAELAREVADRPTPRARHAMGRLHLLKEELDRAEEQLKQVVREEPQNALAHVDLASVYYERGVREKSVTLLSEAVDHLKTAIDVSPKLTEAWFNLALCHEQMMLPTQAQADWKRYLELDSSSPWAGEARSRLQRLVSPGKSFVTPAQLSTGLLAAAAGNEEEKFRRLALDNFITAFNLAREDFLDKYLEAHANNDRAAAAKYLDLMRRTARLAREDKTEYYLADLVAFVADAKQPALDRVKEIRALLRQGDERHEKGDYTPALSSYKQAVVLAEQIGDICHAEHARYGLARIYISSIETPKRQRLRETLVRETERHNHKVLYARSLLAWGNALMAAQLLTKGLEVSVIAYQTALPLGDFDTMVNGLRFSGRAYADIGDYESAIARNFQSVQVISQHQVSPLRSCQAYIVIAEIFYRAVKPQLALDYQLEALDYCKRTGNPTLPITAKSGIGKYYALTGQPQQAEIMFRESMAEFEGYNDKLGRTLQRTELSILIGDAYLQQVRANEAANAYKTALGLVTGSKNRRYLAMAHQGLATAFLRQGLYIEGEKELLLSIKLAEDVRKDINDASLRGSFRGRKLDIYRTMMEFQVVARKDFKKAFYFAESSRNRELLDAIATQSAIKWNAHQATLNYAAGVEVPDLRRVQSDLPNNAQLVEYAITDQQLLIWLITNSGWKSYSTQIGDQQLQQLCGEYLTELQSVRDPALLKKKAGDLYAKLVEPLSRDLEPNRILVIIPDGVLGAIPFPALFSSASSRYLIEDYAVVTIPSAAVLAHTLKIGQTSAKRRPESLLVLSNPKLDPKQFPSLKPLPATEREAESVSSHYVASLKLSYEQATKLLLLQNIDRYDVVHLATHSITNEHNPLLSSVLLSSNGRPGAAIDGNLRAFEIFGLKLTRPRLVILSSCRSGLNARSSSNGLGGLAHAFFKAGVPAVIASLWEVEDSSAAELMSQFHYYHREEKQPFCQALRSAQLQMLNKQDSPWKHPYYWAAFQFSGNGFTS